MANDLQIDQRIAAILTGSGLPMDRRAEVAEELRVHLQQSVARGRQAGLTEDQAIEEALADFGSPEVIRRQLRRQQRMLDRRDTLTDIRRSQWTVRLPVAAIAFYAAVIAVLHPLPFSPLERFMWGSLLFVGFALLVFVPTYWAALFARGIERRRPRAEYRALASLGRGLAMGGVLLAYALIWAPLWVMPFMPVLLDAPEFAHLLPGAFLNIWWVAVVESAGYVLGLLVFGVLASGLGVALYERTRCFDGPAVPAGD
jgi:hypothetical protein